jgi:hypothetical protein
MAEADKESSEYENNSRWMIELSDARDREIKKNYENNLLVLNNTTERNNRLLLQG